MLNEHDLAGVEPGALDGAPIDEYLNEALPIAGILVNRGVVKRADVVDVWTKWFSDDLSWMSDDAWSDLLAELNRENLR